MARAAVYAVLAGCVVWLSGCGTIFNFNDDPKGPGGQRKVYGGVRFDASEGGNASMLLLGDMLLSAVADTLTLPWTLTATLRKAEQERDPGKPTPVDTPTPVSDPAQQPASMPASRTSPALPAAEQHPGP